MFLFDMRRGIIIFLESFVSRGFEEVVVVFTRRRGYLFIGEILFVGYVSEGLVGGDMGYFREDGV